MPPSWYQSDRADPLRVVTIPDRSIEGGQFELTEEPNSKLRDTVTLISLADTPPGHHELMVVEPPSEHEDLTSRRVLATTWAHLVPTLAIRVILYSLADSAET